MNKPRESEIFHEYPVALRPRAKARIGDSRDKVTADNQAILDQCLEDLEIKAYSLRGLKSVRHAMNKFFRYIHKPYSSVTKEDIAQYGAYLKEQNFMPYSISRYLCSLKKFFVYCFDNFLILTNPVETLVMSRILPRLPDVLTQEEALKLLEQPDILTPLGVRDKAILETLYSTGIRLSEAVNLNVDDIDIVTGFLRVNSGKGNKDRVLPLTKSACVALKEYLTNIRPVFCKNNPGEVALFVGVHVGHRIDITFVSRLVRDYARQAKIPKRVTVHLIRHSLATHLLQNGVHLTQIQKLLGHTKVSITQLYTHINPKELKEAQNNYHPREAGLKWKI